MKTILTFLYLLCLSLTHAQLKQHQWKERVFLIISENNSSSVKKQWKELISKKVELKERKLVIYKILPQYFIESENELMVKSSLLYKKFKTDKKPFEIRLIGLDGGTKLEQNQPITSERLFALIDGMPMRQIELKNKN